MGKYDHLVRQIVDNIGGKDNVDNVRHCVTRLRFTLKDEGVANTEVIKELDGVVTVIQSAGQYQVVIGNHVPDVYKEVLTQIGFEVQTDGTAKKMNLKDKIFDLVSGIMMPSIFVLSASGIIQGINAILLATGAVAPGSSVSVLLEAIGKAMMYYFPIFIGLNAARKLGMNEYLGMALGAILVMPSITGVDLTFFGTTFNASYTETVLPAILVVALAAPLEKWLNRVIPDVVKSFVTPVIVLLVIAPIGFLLIGPFANWIGAQLSVMIQTLIGFSPMIAGMVSGALWQVFVMFGVHIMVLLPSIMNLMTGVPDQFIAFITVVSFAQTAVVLAIWLKTKNKKLRAISFPAWVSGIFGVTEPAIYGVTLPRVKYFVISCIGGAIGGGLVGLLGIQAYTMSGMGVFALAGFVGGESAANIVGMLAAVAVSFVVGFVMTYAIYKDDSDNKEVDVTQEPKVGKDKVLSPLTGDVIELSKVQDDAFAQGAMGEGVAILPTDGKVYAPFDGTLTMIFPTKHACGVLSDNGTELLIHIGLDTVQLNGQHFTAHKAQGERVKAGDLLIEFDIDAIKEAGYLLETPVIITNRDDYLDIITTDSKAISAGELLLSAIFK